MIKLIRNQQTSACQLESTSSSNDESSAFSIQSLGEIDHFDFHRRINNLDYNKIEFEEIQKQAKIPGFTLSMCALIRRELSQDRRTHFNCKFQKTQSGFDVYREFKPLTRLDSEVVVVCLAQNTRLFAGYYRVPMEPNNPQNVVFSLTGGTVHRFKHTLAESTDKILLNLRWDSRDQPVHTKYQKLFFRFGDQDVVVYQNRLGKLICESTLGKMYSNEKNGEYHLGGQKVFELDNLWLFEVERF